MPKIPANLTAVRLRELARTGAKVTVKRPRAETIAIERTFPELRLPQFRRALLELRVLHGDELLESRLSRYGEAPLLLIADEVKAN